MKEPVTSKDKPREPIGVVPTRFATQGPKTIPRIDYERIFVMDAGSNLIGEYALDDDCPVESSDLRRCVPVSGLRHLVSFYEGEFAFTPFKVDDLWFVVLTRGVPRIEERGSIGTLLAAARVHIPPMMEPLLSKREAELRAKEQELADREKELTRREEHAGSLDAELRVSSTALSEREKNLRVREASLSMLHEYAQQMERVFILPKADKPKEPGPAAPLAPP